MQNDETGELERIIDRALPGYGGSEPLAGLEQRILARIRVAETARRRSWMWRDVAASALGAVFVIAAIAVWPPDRPDPILRADLQAARSQSVAANPPATPDTHRVAAHLTAPPKGRPKLGEFPAAVPITAEERALLALPAAVADLRKRTDEPLQIEEIQIARLSVDDSGQ